MTKNPITNALAAITYITLLVLSINWMFERIPDYDGLLGPIIMLSLLTLSVAFMGFTFFSEPLQLLLEKKNKEAVKLFLQTIGSFAVLLIIFVVILIVIY